MNESSKERAWLQKLTSRDAASLKRPEKNKTVFDMPLPLVRANCQRPTRGYHNGTAKMTHLLAEHVNAIVGLNEALTWKNNTLRGIWAIILCTGIGATVLLIYQSAMEYFDETTATKVIRQPKASYEYPPLLLCPGVWFDASKAYSMGFPPDAVNYSFGYFADMLKPYLKDPVTAKRRFFNSFEANSLSSLDEYLRAIAVDIPIVADLKEFANFTSSISWCSNCADKIQLQKMFFNRGVCYLLQLAAQDAADIGRPYSERLVLILLHDRTNGMPVLYKNQWRLSVINNRNATIKYNVAAPIFLSSYAIHYITVLAEQDIMLKDNSGSCFSREQAGLDYTPEACYAECMNEYHSQISKCLQFEEEPYSPDTIPRQPGNFCNFFDSQDRTGFYKRMDAQDEHDDHPDEAIQSLKCTGQCPPLCQKVLYELTTKSKLDDEEDFPPELLRLVKTARQQKMSLLGLRVMHQGVYQGGILVLKQVSTITPAGLISNLGGALGLFVGGTAMTFVQLIMFLVKLALEKRSMRVAQLPPKDAVYTLK